MQRAHCQFRVLRLDDHGNLYFRGRDHFNIDALGGQNFEHFGGNPGMSAHADAHDGHLCDISVNHYALGVQDRNHLFHDGQRFLVIGF